MPITEIPSEIGREGGAVMELLQRDERPRSRAEILDDGRVAPNRIHAVLELLEAHALIERVELGGELAYRVSSEPALALVKEGLIRARSLRVSFAGEALAEPVIAEFRDDATALGWIGSVLSKHLGTIRDRSIAGAAGRLSLRVYALTRMEPPPEPLPRNEVLAGWSWPPAGDPDGSLRLDVRWELWPENQGRDDEARRLHRDPA